MAENKNLPAELESAEEEQQAESRLQQARRIVHEQIKARAKKAVVGKIKKAILKKIIIFLFTTPAGWWILGVTLGIFALIVIIFIVIAIFAYAQEDPCGALQMYGEATGNAILNLIGATCSK